jgi:CRISPR-associated protein Csm2
MAYDKHKNNQKNNHEEVQLDKIELDYTKDEQLFGDTALKWSKQIMNESDRTKNKINQIRTFYEKVLELEERSEGMSNEEYKKEIFPFVVMLKSKVAYAKTRNLVSDTFEKMINQCVENAITAKKMQNFKYFFEAIIGFYPKNK